MRRSTVAALAVAISIVLLTPDAFAGAVAYEGSKFAVCDAQGARLVESAYLFKRSERPTGKPLSGTLAPP